LAIHITVLVVRARHLIAASGKSIAFFFVHAARFLLSSTLPSSTEATSVFLTTRPLLLLTTKPNLTSPSLKMGFEKGMFFLTLSDVIAHPPRHDLSAPIKPAQLEKPQS
jgi:hypothetical protein